MIDISSTAQVDEGVRIVGPVKVGAHCIIEAGAIIGAPARLGEPSSRVARVGSGTHVRAYATIYEGSDLGENCRVAHHAIIRDGSRVQDDTYIMPMTEVHQDVVIGSGCRVRGFVCSRASVGDGSSVLGSLVHEYQARAGGIIEPSPSIGSNVVVGMGAYVIGGISVGNGAFIAAGAIVTRDVSPGSIVAGVPARLMRIASLDPMIDETSIFPNELPREM